ncbi:MAG: hypothetical protein F4Y02_12495 [Chloroflexi bacterium]|nr:hypothetical protein [Chloroflexota bacterium]
MFTNRLFDNGLMKACLAAVFAIGLTACSSSSNTASVEPPAPPPPTTDPEPTPPSDLETTQAAAMAAAEAAKAASDAADMAADGAEAATANVATLQTGEMARMHAEAARDAADMAMAAYMNAKAASDAAAAATTASAAGAARVNAEAAAAEASAQQDAAEGAAMMASEAADMELMIDGKDKSVGGSSLNADDGRLEQTIADQTTITGRMMSMDPGHEAPAFTGRHGAQENPTTTAMEAVAYQQAVAARSVDIGRTLDSSDDTSRLMLITHYQGSKTVRTYYRTPLANGGENIVATHVAGSRAGQIFIHNGADGTAQTDDDLYAELTFKGMYYPVTDSGAVVADSGTATENAAADDLDASDMIAADAEPAAVYSYFHLGADGQPGGDGNNADGVRYVIETGREETHADDQLEISYARVDTMVTLPAIGTDPATQVAAKDIQTTAQLPDAKPYDHIHFGVWAGLSDAGDDGFQTIADLGIGFVQSIGDGMTAAGDMPNRGTATYNGDWAAAVQGASEGAMMLEHGAATLTADLDKSTLTAALDGLATLSGAIAGNTFAGTMATIMDDDPHGLDTGGAFTGSFSGGFYGAGAAEAGGVFDFSSDGSGAFRGAFGGVQADDE